MMSYGSRTQYSSRSSTIRGRGGAQRTPPYTPHMMNGPVAAEESSLQEEEGEGSLRHRHSPEVTRGARGRSMQRYSSCKVQSVPQCVDRV